MGQSSSATPPTTPVESIVYVIDDDRLMLGALGTLFRSIELGVKTFSSATEFLQHALPAMPSCLVLDVRMPQLGGLDLQAELGRLGINMPVIFITGHGDIPMSVRAMKAGAVDFLTKPFRDQELIDAVMAALQRDRKRRSEEESRSDVQARFASLTRREGQIMGFVTGGLMNKQVAARIGISERTVKIHRGNLMRKMHAKSLAELVVMAETVGIRGQEKPNE
jgi:FixJ family two-component response regulator